MPPNLSMFTEFGLFRNSNFVTAWPLPQNLILSPWNADNFVSWQNANEHCMMRWKQKNTSNYNKLSIKTQTLSLQFQETSIFYIHLLKGFWDTIYFSRKIKTAIRKTAKGTAKSTCLYKCICKVNKKLPPKGFLS